MRPKTKDDAQKLTLTLSAPARKYLMSEALRRGVSRTQIVEDLIFGLADKQKATPKGKPLARGGGGAGNTLNPSAGGSEILPNANSPLKQAQSFL